MLDNGFEIVVPKKYKWHHSHKRSQDFLAHLNMANYNLLMASLERLTKPTSDYTGSSASQQDLQEENGSNVKIFKGSKASGRDIAIRIFDSEKKLNEIDIEKIDEKDEEHLHDITEFNSPINSSSNSSFSSASSFASSEPKKNKEIKNKPMNQRQF